MSKINLFCKHQVYVRTRTFHGDAIYQVFGWNRSEWKCNSCSKIVWSQYLDKVVITPWYKRIFT